jgi:large subunit ribosomal protein L10
MPADYRFTNGGDSMPKDVKVEMVRELREDIGKSTALLMTDYRGLKVSETQALRRKLREAGADYKIVKNTLFDLAFEAGEDSEIKSLLVGPTAIAFVHNDAIASAKAIVDFMRDHKAMSIKGGYVDGRVYGPEQIQALSKVPPRDVLISQMLGAVQGPLSGLVGTLQGIMSNLVYTLQAVADQKAA